MINRRELGQLAGMTLAAVSLGACTAPPASTPSSADAHTSFASLKQIDAGLWNTAYAEDGPPEGTRLALRHPQLRRHRARAGRQGLPSHSSVPARLWHHDVSVS